MYVSLNLSSTFPKSGLHNVKIRCHATVENASIASLYLYTEKKRGFIKILLTVALVFELNYFKFYDPYLLN